MTTYLNRAVLLLCLLTSTAVQAIELDSDLYGEINLSYDWVDSSPGSSDGDWKSYASRLGLKGEYALSDSLNLVYKLEQQVDPAHGGTHKDTFFSTRNTYVGVSGKYGMVYFGAHDTPFKRAASRVDLFNDQGGDIKNLMNGEVRAKDSVGYHSAKYEGWQAKVIYIPSDSQFDSSQSFSLTHELNDLYVGISLDADVRKNDKPASKTKVYDAQRAVMQYSPGPWKLGVILQRSEQQNSLTAGWESAAVVNVSYEMGKFTFMAQEGKSDILASDLSSHHLGVHYNFYKKTKVYLYYWNFDKGVTTDMVSLGLEHKF